LDPATLQAATADPPQWRSHSP